MKCAHSLSILLGVSTAFLSLPAADQPQWGTAWSRNQVSTERGLPATFDVKSGRNIKCSFA